MRPQIFFVTPMCGFSCFFWGGAGISFFCNFYEINSSQDFFLYCENFGVDGIWIRVSGFTELRGFEMFPEGPKIEKIQSRDASLKNSRFQPTLVCSTPLASHGSGLIHS